MNVGTLFSGAGGLDYYFHDKFDVIFANDIRDPPANTYQKNHGFKISDTTSNSTYIRNDITNVSFNGIKLDCVVGGPPCQDFSVLRSDKDRKGITVTRGKLYQQFIRVLKETDPDIFVFENVPGLISANSGIAYNTILGDLSNNYHILYSGIVDSSHFGVPQRRKRLIILGIKHDKYQFKYSKYCNDVLSGKNSIFKKYPLTSLEAFEGKSILSLQDKYYDIMHEYDDLINDITIPAMKKYRDTWNKLTFDIVQDYCNIHNIKDDDITDIIKNSRDMLNGVNVLDCKYNNDIQYDKPEIMDRMSHIPPDQNHIFVLGTKYEIKSVNMSNIYRRLHPLKPGYTVIAGGGGGTWSYHYEYNRGKLTNRERARLQTFPDDYQFEGNMQQVRSQIGEAVPVILGKVLSEIIDNIIHDDIPDMDDHQLLLDSFS